MAGGAFAELGLEHERAFVDVGLTRREAAHDLDDRRIAREADPPERDEAGFEHAVFFHEDDGFDRCGACDNCERMAQEAARRATEPEPTADPLHKPLPQMPGPRFEPGTAVRVPRYGAAVVASADAQTVTVTFPNGSTRCFLAAYVTRKR